MTYEEYFRHLEELRKTHSGRQLTEQELDEEIALIRQLPCTGGGPSTPLLGEHSAIEVGWLGSGAELPAQFDLRGLDSGAELPTGFWCIHCAT